MSGPSSNFSAFLQARMSNTYADSPRLPQHHHHHLRQFHQPPVRTMATQQDAEVFGFDTQDLAYGNQSFITSHDIPSYGDGTSMTTNRMQTFEEMARSDPSTVSALTNVSQWQEVQQTVRGTLPFRALEPMPVSTAMDSTNVVNFRDYPTAPSSHYDSMNTSFSGSVRSSYDSASASTSFTGTDNMQPLKIDTSVAGSTTPPILETPVDAAQYENVPDTEWVWASTDWENSSHSSMRTDSTGPRTPVSPHTANSSQSSYFSTGYQGSPSLDIVSKVDGSGSDMFPLTMPRSVLANCQCNGCNIPVAPHQLSNTWTAGQSQASFMGQLPMYGSGVANVTGLPVDFSHNQTAVVPFVPRQASTSVTSSLGDVERQTSETTDEDSDDSESEVEELNVNDQAINDATHRQKRDSFLLSMRRKGRSYKEIKELGKFTEAESTLRGRVRVLTKDKSERVRKPEWDSNDIRLLNRAFERYAGFDDDGEVKPRRRELPSRIPWKKISGWMKSHGSSYPFAPATCARKWKALN